MTAQVEVRNGITIAGRGAVLICFVRSGTVRAGQRTQPLPIGDAPARCLEVVAVQKLAAADASGSAVGLVFKGAPSLKELQRALPPGALLVLQDASEATDQEL
ncbi:MAG: hypothetical protein ABI742_00445 [Gemmatimonadota bacterium]